MIIRNAEIKDAEKIAEIYSYYVENTAITFEYVAPSTEEFEKRISTITEKYPFLAAEDDGKVIGYAYAHGISEREAYKISVEMSVYVDKEYRRNNVGKKLYEELEKALKNMGISNLYACIAVTDEQDEHLTNDSVFFHKKMGYKTVGKFSECGIKFSKKYSVVWMEKII